MNRKELGELVRACEELALFQNRSQIGEGVLIGRRSSIVVAQLAGTLLARALADTSPEELRALLRS